MKIFDPLEHLRLDPAVDPIDFDTPRIEADLFRGAECLGTEYENLLIGGHNGDMLLKKWKSADFPEMAISNEFFWTYGWKAKVGNNQYGDYLAMSDDSRECREAAKAVLLEQAEASIKGIPPSAMAS